MAVKVSIVVPAYNVEPYIAQCIDSLLAQTLQEIEIIVVDDGSPDKSGEIADAYARKDARVKVIHQNNMGLGPARNSGMKIATGEYIGFVDSDDWVKPEMYERFYAAAVMNEADIVVGGHCEIAGKRVLAVRKHPMAGTVLSSAAEIMAVRNDLYGLDQLNKSADPIPMSVCMSIYRRKAIVESGVHFVHVLSEDKIFNISAYACAQVLAFIDATDYCYRKEAQSSITQNFSERKSESIRGLLALLSEMASRESNPECRMRVKRTAIDYCRIYVCLVERSGLPVGQKCAYIKQFAENKAVCGFWEGYPIQSLPIQQRVFHEMIVRKQYGMALALCAIRERLRKR